MSERTCEVCGNTMTEGYCYDGGRAYYCSDNCLTHDFTEEEWEHLCDNEESESYWTQW